jgi:protein-S-isoprenylcysteine O-methyltransferase Ste14
LACAISAPLISLRGESILSRITLDDWAVLHHLQARRKLTLLLLVVGAAPIVALVQSGWPADGWARSTIETVGLWLIVGCIFGRAWCALYIGGRKSVELVDRGPYSISRNPLYLFSCVGTIGVGLRTGSLAVGALFLIAAIAVMVPVIRVEELVMRRTFGGAFDDYCARVPRLLPRFSLWRDAEVLTLEPRHIRRIFGDGLFFACTIPLIDVIAWLQGQGIFPVLARLP